MKQFYSILINFIKKYYIAIILFSLYLLITYLLEIPNCLIKLIWGIPCPGCGMTRAGFSVLKFDFISALKYNPLIFVFPFILFIMIFHEIPLVKKLYKSKILWITLTIIIFATYVLRLIFVFPNPPMDYNPNNLLIVIINFIKNLIQIIIGL